MNLIQLELPLEESNDSIRCRLRSESKKRMQTNWELGESYAYRQRLEAA